MTTNKRTCSVEGCNRSHHAHGFCHSHSKRNRVLGSPFLKYETTRRAVKGEIAEWVTNMDRNSMNCIIWPFSVTCGYGCWKTVIRGITYHRAHRAILALNDRDPLPGEVCLHTCGNGHIGCVNPKHLQWGTVTKNNREDERVKLSIEKARKIRAMLANGCALADVASKYNVDKSVISKIKREKIWREDAA